MNLSKNLISYMELKEISEQDAHSDIVDKMTEISGLLIKAGFIVINQEYKEVAS
jgi:hypothetical protein